MNFLYVVKLYVQNDEIARASWRQDARRLFREEIRKIISNHYTLYALMPHEGIDAQQFFHENFKHTAGKVYSPYPDADGRQFYALALQRPGDVHDDRLSEDGRREQYSRLTDENWNIIRLIETAFYMVPIDFGKDPRLALVNMAIAHPVIHGPVAAMTTGVQVVSGVSGGLKNAVDASEWCPCPAAQCPDPEAVKLLVLPHTMGANLYRVIAGTLQKDKTAEGIKNLTSDAFKSVHFPTMPCHLWRVTKVEA